MARNPKQNDTAWRVLSEPGHPLSAAKIDAALFLSGYPAGTIGVVNVQTQQVIEIPTVGFPMPPATTHQS